MSVYIGSMARRTGAAGGRRGSSASNRGGPTRAEERCEAAAIVQEQWGGPGRAVLGTGYGLGRSVCQGVCMSVQELSYCLCLPCCCTVLLQHGADPNIRNTDGKSALDLAEPSAKAVLTGQCHIPFGLLKRHTLYRRCDFTRRV